MDKFKDLVVTDSVSYTLSEPIYPTEERCEMIKSPYFNMSINLKVFLQPNSYSIAEKKLKEIIYCIEDKRNVDDLLTVRHYAEKHNLSKETVRKRMLRGKLPYILIDGVYFIKDK